LLDLEDRLVEQRVLAGARADADGRRLLGARRGADPDRASAPPNDVYVPQHTLVMVTIST